MDVPAPIIIPSSHLSNGKVPAALSNSTSEKSTFSEHFDEKVSQLKSPAKSAKNNPNKAAESVENAVVDDRGVPNSSEAERPVVVKNTDQATHFQDEIELPTVDNALTNDDGVFLPHDMILTGEAGDIAKKLIPDNPQAGGNGLPLDHGEVGEAATIQADILDDLKASEKLAFNPLGGLTSEHFVPSAAARGVLQASGVQADIAAKVEVKQAALFQNADRLPANFKSDVIPSAELAEFEVALATNLVSSKAADAVALKVSEQAQGVGLLTQLHGELVRDAVNLRKEGIADVNLNLSAAHLNVNAEINSANKPMLSVESPINSARWSTDLGKNIQWMVNQSINGAQIRLNPQQLGPIEIRLQMENGQATVAFTAQHAATREAIDAALPRLREMLSEQDVSLVDVNVSQHSFAEQHQQQQRDFSGLSETGSPSEELATNPAFSDESAASLSSDGLINEYV